MTEEDMWVPGTLFVAPSNHIYPWVVLDREGDTISCTILDYNDPLVENLSVIIHQFKCVRLDPAALVAARLYRGMSAENFKKVMALYDRVGSHVTVKEGKIETT